ncbi:MAG: SDR family oxidoreductase [Spirochaetota bacterium]
MNEGIIKKRVPVPGRFLGKTAIVTGGSSGIGKSVAEELLAEAAFVVFTGISETGSAVEKDLVSRGYPVRFCRGDMMDEVFCRSVIACAVSETGRINYLVNNAFSFIGKGADATGEEWERVLFSGPVAYARMVQGCIEPMKAEGGGSIVNMSSISAHVAQFNRWTYNSAKGAVTQLTKCQAMDLGQYNIRVNCVSPAYIWTRELEKEARNAGGGRAKWDPIWGKFHMLLRCAEPFEVAGPILFLLSDDASFVTGSDLKIDGGYLGMGPDGIDLSDSNRWTKK